MCCIRTFVGFQVSICNAATLDQKLMVLLKMLSGVFCSENATQTKKGGIYSVYSVSPWNHGWISFGNGKLYSLWFWFRLLCPPVRERDLNFMELISMQPYKMWPTSFLKKHTKKRELWSTCGGQPATFHIHPQWQCLSQIPFRFQEPRWSTIHPSHWTLVLFSCFQLGILYEF